MKIKSMFTKKSFLITFILGIYVICLSVGYAFFSESLTINGVASTVDYYEGEKLPVTAILRDTTNNYYFTSDFDSGYLISYKSESWQDDTYVLNLDKTVLESLEGKTVTYTISFVNPTNLNYTNGVISTEVTGNASDISITDGLLSKTEVAPGEVVDVSFSIRIDEFSTFDSSAKATITYTYQNKPRYLYFIVNYSTETTYENLFTDELLLNPLNSGTVTKTEEGYLVSRYPAAYYTAYQPLFKQLVDSLEPGVTYMLVRDYQGAMPSANGLITLRSGEGNDDVVVRCEFGKGIKSVTFTLTQEQIDSIDRMYIYGNANGDNTFKFIQLRKLQ